MASRRYGWFFRLGLPAGLFGCLLLILAPGVAPALATNAGPVTVTMSAAPSPAISGGQLIYTISVVNTGGAKVTSVAISDQVNGLGGFGVPTQLELTSSLGSCQQNAGLVMCAVAQMDGGQSWTMTIRGVVTAAAGTTLNNTVTVAGTKSSQTFSQSATTATQVNANAVARLPLYTRTTHRSSCRHRNGFADDLRYVALPE
jgi:uncharacterized repeat protein (TIGR01451 family)